MCQTRAKLDPTRKNLMVFDDLMLSKQNKCEDYYVRGRHNNVDCFLPVPELLQTPKAIDRGGTPTSSAFSTKITRISTISIAITAAISPRKSSAPCARNLGTHPVDLSPSISLAPRRMENTDANWTSSIEYNINDGLLRRFLPGERAGVGRQSSSRTSRSRPHHPACVSTSGNLYISPEDPFTGLTLVTTVLNAVLKGMRPLSIVRISIRGI